MTMQSFTQKRSWLHTGLALRFQASKHASHSECPEEFTLERAAERKDYDPSA